MTVIARVAMPALIVLALAANPARAGRQVTFTRAAIEASGITQLSDLLPLVDAWAPSSGDFDTWTPTPRALSLPRATQWTVVLNGQTLDLSVFDAVDLGLVPVTLAEVDSVVFSDEAGAGVAWDSGRGRIEIYATPSASSRAANATGRIGQETGDTGQSASVSTIGPDASLVLSRRAPRWYATASGQLSEYPYSDPAIWPRTSGALADYRPGAVVPSPGGITSSFYDPRWPSVLRTSASLRAAVNAGGGWHEVMLSLANARRYFHYSEPFGTNVPTDQRTGLAGVSGSLDLASNTRLGYRAQFSSNHLSDQDGVLAFDYDWSWQRTRAGVSVTHDAGRARAGAFASVEDRRVRTGGPLTRNADTFVRTGVFASGRASRRWRLSGNVDGTFSGNDAGIDAGVTADWVVRPADTLRARVRTSQRLFAEDDNLWLWTVRGYDLLAREGTSVSFDGPVGRTRVTAADVGWTSRGVLGGVDLDLGLRRFDDAYVEQRDFTWDATTCSFHAPTRIVTGQTGHVGVLRFRLWHAFGENSWGDFTYAYAQAFNSDPAFGTTWQTIPRNRLGYTIHAQPRRWWGYRFGVTHVSSTLWTDYAGVDGVTCTSNGVRTVFRSHLDGVSWFDAAVRFTRWHERAVLDLIARNLFDAHVRYHPAGATQSLTLYAQLAINWSAP